MVSLTSPKPTQVDEMRILRRLKALKHKVLSKKTSGSAVPTNEVPTSTLTFAGDKKFTDISTAPEVLMPVLVGTSLVGTALPLVFFESVAREGKFFTAVGLASIAAGVAVGGIMYALDN